MIGNAAVRFTSCLRLCCNRRYHRARLVLFPSYSLRRTVEQTRVAQIILNKIATRAQEINNLGWLAIQEQDVTPKSDGEVRAAKRELLETAAAVKRQTYHSRVIHEVSPLLDNYMRVADYQWQLVETGHFEAARRVDFEEVNPQFDVLQSKISEASEAEDQWAEAIALRSRNELLVAAFLAALAVLMLFQRFQMQKHSKQLVVAGRDAFQMSEERFRALTAQSTDIVLITDDFGLVKYASPSVSAVLGIEEQAFLGRNLFDTVHPDDGSQLKITARVGADQSPVVEFKIRHADGRWLHFECVIRNLLKQPKINGLVFNAREITEPRKLKHNSYSTLPMTRSRACPTVCSS
jgi:PAS domain S-box-containing protein